MLYYFYFFLISVFWGGSYIAIKVIVDQCPPIFGAFIRVGVAVLLFLILGILGRKKMSLPKKYAWRVWVSGLFLQGIPFTFLFWGQKYVSPGLTSILICTYPIWTFLLNLIFLRGLEPPSWKQFSGVIMSFFGVFLIFYPQLEIQGNQHLILGIFGMIFVAFCYGVGTVMSRILLIPETKVGLFENLVHQFCASFCFLFFATLVLEKGFPFHLFVSPSLTLSVLYLGICSTAFAWVLFFVLLREWGALRTAATGYTAPLLTLILGYFAFHHVLSPFEALGSVAIVS